MTKPLLLALSFFALFPAAGAIVIRHDRDDAKYQELGKGFDAVGLVFEAGGTLIDKRWILTAAHVAEELSPFTSFVVIKGQRHRLDRVIIHPAYAKEGIRSGRDLALLRLADPINDGDPIPIYRGSAEAGQIVTFVGNGDTGNGNTGPTKSDGLRRGAHNKLERVNDTSVFFEFDPPEKAEDLEGISGPGDSGGPAFIKVDGKWQLAGISSQNMGNGKGLCRYGTTEIYARVSTAAAWIDETIKNSPSSTTEWTIESPFKSWPSGRPAEVAQALIAAYNTCDAAKMEEFNQKYRPKDVLARRTPEQRADGYKGVFDPNGPVEVRAIATAKDGRLIVLVHSKKANDYRQLSLFFDDPEFTRFVGYNMSPAVSSEK